MSRYLLIVANNSIFERDVIAENGEKKNITFESNEGLSRLRG